MIICVLVDKDVQGVCVNTCVSHGDIYDFVSDTAADCDSGGDGGDGGSDDDYDGNSNVDMNVVSARNNLLNMQSRNVSAQKNLSLINVCGLCSKLRYPEFVDFVGKQDVVCVVETKLDDLDECSVPGFTFF